jgi:cell division control protein 7
LAAGTFSSVYKAIDLKNSSFDNSLWLTDPSPSPDATSATITNNDKKKKKKPKVYVALKRIYVTSSPTRIENEISILEDLRFVYVPCLPSNSKQEGK